MNNFPTAAVARLANKHSRSFDALVQAAETAIFEAARKTLTAADIDYVDIDDETHKKFHKFIISRGFSGGKLAANTASVVYRIRW